MNEQKQNFLLNTLSVKNSHLIRGTSLYTWYQMRNQKIVSSLVSFFISSAIKTSSRNKLSDSTRILFLAVKK